MKKTIAVIGSSNHSDSTIISRLAAVGYPILLADQKWESIKECILQQHSSAVVEILDCSLECAWQADAVLLYHSEEYQKLLHHIKNVITGKTIINMVSDFNDKEVQCLLPFSKVVDTVSGTTPNILSYEVRGDNCEAVAQVLLLFEEIGIQAKRKSD